MRIVILGGAGIIGQVIARDLVQDVDEVVIADLDEDAARAVAKDLGDKVTAERADATDAVALRGVLEGASACINSVNYYFNLQVMRACLDAKVPYIDLGGLFHMTRRQLELHDDYERQGVTAVLGLGSCPGVANVHAGWLGGMLEGVEAIRIYNGSTLEESGSLAAPYAIQTILDEISMPAMVFRGGEFIECPPLGEEEMFDFPEPIGRAKTHLSLHSEVATIPLSLADKGIQECFFKITFFGYAEPALRKLQFLSELGFASDEPIEVDGATVRPRAVLLKLLDRLPAAQEAPISKGFKAVVTEATGTAEDQSVLLRAETVGGPHQDWGVSGGKLLVAAPPAIVARWLADGRLDQPGVWPPEQVIAADPFFAELAQRGFTTRLSKGVTFASPSHTS